MRLTRVECLSRESSEGMGFYRRLHLYTRRVRRSSWRCCGEGRAEARAVDRETIRKDKETKKKGEIGEEAWRQRSKKWRETKGKEKIIYLWE